VITDPVFYRLFESSPETFFLLLGMPADLAKDMAARYQYEAIEVKETAHRLDGVFRPKELGLPLYFVEVQFYRLPTVFADLLAKAYSYLKQHDPAQRFLAVVLFATRALEPEELGPYQALQADLIELIETVIIYKLSRLTRGRSRPCCKFTIFGKRVSTRRRKRKASKKSASGISSKGLGLF